MQQKPKNVGMRQKDSRCWRCARAIPHKAEDHPRCQCGAVLGPIRTIIFCAEHLSELSPEERKAHKNAHQNFHAMGSG